MKGAFCEPNMSQGEDRGMNARQYIKGTLVGGPPASAVPLRPWEPPHAPPVVERRSRAVRRRSSYGLQDIALHDSKFFPAESVDIHTLASRLTNACAVWSRGNPEAFCTTMKDGGVWVTRTK